jgi:hypothetical protein
MSGGVRRKGERQCEGEMSGSVGKMSGGVREK